MLTNDFLLKLILYEYHKNSTLSYTLAGIYFGCLYIGQLVRGEDLLL